MLGTGWKKRLQTGYSRLNRAITCHSTLRFQTASSVLSLKSEQLSIRQESAILLCSPAVRMYVKQLLERYFPDLPVLSYNELEANVEVQSIGVVDI